MNAQSRLDCPRPVRETRYRLAPKPYLELGAGFSKPVLFHNGAGAAGDGHRFISRPSPYAAAIGVLPLSSRFAVYGGASVTQIWQGLGFDYSDAYGSVAIRSYAGSLVASLPVGVRYSSGNRLSLNAGPYLAYASHTGQSEQSQSGGASGSIAGYRFTSPDSRGFNVGLRLTADFRVLSRLAITLSCAADGLRAASGYSSVNLGGRAEPVYEGKMEPHLLHAGLGLSYRLFYQED